MDYFIVSMIPHPLELRTRCFGFALGIGLVRQGVQSKTPRAPTGLAKMRVIQICAASRLAGLLAQRLRTLTARSPVLTESCEFSEFLHGSL